MCTLRTPDLLTNFTSSTSSTRNIPQIQIPRYSSTHATFASKATAHFPANQNFSWVLQYLLSGKMLLRGFM